MARFIVMFLFMAILQACQVSGGGGGGGGAGVIITNHQSHQNAFTVSMPSNGWKKLADNIDITLTFPVAVTVAGGVPSIKATIGSTVRDLTYVSGSGTTSLLFRYTVTSSDLDTDGVVFDGAITLNGATLTYNNGGTSGTATSSITVPASSVKVDGIVPVLTNITPPADGIYQTNGFLAYMLDFSEPVYTSGNPGFNLVLNSGNVLAAYVSGRGTTSLTFNRTVRSTDLDGDGITTASTFNFNATNSLKDIAGNAVASAITPVNSSGIRVNVVGPAVTSIDVPAASTYLETQNMDFTVHFDYPVVVTGSPQLTINLTTGNVNATYLSGSGTTALVFRHTVLPGEQDNDGIVLSSPIQLNGGTLKNTLGTQDAILSYTSPSGAGINVDAKDPQVQSINNPSNGSYGIGQTLTFGLVFNETVTVTGTPRIGVTIGATNRYFNYVSGSGTSVLSFSYTIVNGEQDSDGISMAGTIDLNGGSIVDAVSRNAVLTYTPSNTSLILVDSTQPYIATMNPPANGNFYSGQALDFVATYNKAVVITGTPRVPLTIGSSTVYANYVSGSGTTNITYRYTIQTGDLDLDGIGSTTPMELNSGTIKDTLGNDALLTFTAPDTSAVWVDAIAPTITSVTPPSDATYLVNQNLDFVVNFSENVTVTGTPRLALTIGSTTVYANYLSGSGTTALTMRYTVQNNDSDSDGILLASPMQLNSGTIKDDFTNNATLTYTLPTTTGVLVDAVLPVISSVTPPSNGTYQATQNLDFVVNYNKPITVTGTPRLSLTVGAASVNANYLSGSGTTALTFRYTVQNGDYDGNGPDTNSPLDLNSGTLKDAVNNNASLTFTSPNTSAVIVDALQPAISSVTPPSNATYITSQNLDFVVNFNKNVIITGTPRLNLTIGASTVYATYQSGSGTNAVTFRYTVQNNDWDSDGVALNSPAELNGGTIKDSLNNNSSLTFTSPDTTGVLVDGVLPVISSVTPPVNATYGPGQDLTFTVNYNKVMTVTGTPRIALGIGVSAPYATYVSGSGSAALVFKYSIQSGDQDTDGISHSSPVQLNGGTIKDAVNNNGALTFVPADTSGVIVDNVIPSIVSITPPANATYTQGENMDFTVSFNKTVTITGTPRISVTVGVTTVYATYVSGSGTANALFRYTPVFNDLDTDGIVLVSPMDLNGGSIKDIANNNATLTFSPPTTTSVLINATTPSISSITPPSNATYGGGQNLDFVANYNKTVTITGTPRIPLTIGAATVYANYLSGSGTSAITYRYTVQTGDSDTNGIDVVSPMQLNSGTIADHGGTSASLTFTPPTTTSVLVDGVAPTISSITPPANATYLTSQNLDFVVNWSENVTITGTPRIALTIGAATVYATYLSGSGSSATTFRYTVVSNDSDSDGIAMTSPMQLNSGTIKDAVNNNATLTYTAPNTSLVKVDAVLPVISSVTPPSNGTYQGSTNMDFVVNYNKPITVNTAGGTPRMSFVIGSTTVYATYNSGSGTSALTFRYTVQNNDYDTDGIAVSSPLQLNSGTMKDAVNNNASLTFTPPTTTSVLVDALLPVISSVTAPSNGTYQGSQNLDFTVTFNKPITKTGTPRIALTVGAATVYANYYSGTGTSSYVFRYTVANGDLDSDGIAMTSPIQLNGGTLQDAVSRNSALTYTAPNTTAVLVDGVIPAISSITPPSNGTYLGAQNLDFVANFNKVVTVTTGGGTPRLQVTIGAQTVYASYLSGSGSTALTFRYTVQTGDSDSDGIALVSPAQLNGGTIKDSLNNNATLTFTPPSMTSVLVDAVLPIISSVTPPSNGTYTGAQNMDFVVNFNKNITVNTGGGTPRLNLTLGAGTVYATYLSGTGTAALTFRYTVQTSDYDTDGIVLNSSLELNGGTLKDAVNNNAALSFSSPNTSLVKVDALLPVISSVTAPNNGTYEQGQNLNFIVNFNKPVDITGTPRLQVTIGAATVYANYNSGTGTSAVTFRYTVQNNDLDTDGIGLTSPVQLNSGTIKDALARNSALTFTPPTLTSVLVDGVLPVISSVAAPSNGTYALSSNMDFTVTFNKVVSVTGTPRIQLTIGAATVYANYQSGSGSTTWTFRYTVAAGNTDTDGIAVVSPVDLNSGTIKDSLNNNSALTFTPPTTTSVLVDGIVPTISSVTAPSNLTYKLSDNLDFTVNWSEAVTITGTPRIQLTVGVTTFYATYSSGSGSTATVFRYTVGAGDLDTDGIAMTSPLQLNSGTIKDAATNAATLTYTAPNTSLVKVDGVVPTISSVTAPTNGTYSDTGTANMDFTVTWSEAVTITGSPRFSIDVGGTTVYATYSSGTGTTSTVFRYTVAAGNYEDTNGVGVSSPIALNSGTIKDAAGNDATLTFTAPNTASINVDGKAPVLNSITPPSNAAYKPGNNIDFTITFHENVTVSGTPRLTLTVGGATKYANYTSGSGGATLTFRYTVDASNAVLDLDGISIATSIDLNGGTIRDSYTHNSATSFTAPNLTKVYVVFSNTIAWYDFDDSSTVSTSGSNITGVTDKSGSANNITTTSSPGPTWSASGYGTTNAGYAQFNSASSLNLPSLTNVKYVVIAIRSHQSAGASLTVGVIGAATNKFDLKTNILSTASHAFSAASQLKQNNGSLTASSTTASTTWAANTNYIYEIVVTAAATWSSTTLGSSSFNGQIAEVMFLDSSATLTTTAGGQLDTVRDAINAKAGSY